MLQILQKSEGLFDACISRYSCNVTGNVIDYSWRHAACISRYSCNVTKNLTQRSNTTTPALAGIRVMLHDGEITLHNGMCLH